MHPNVVTYEPHTALFVPNDDALFFIRHLSDFGKQRLYKNGSIYLEIHEDLGERSNRSFLRNEGYTRLN